MDVGDPATPVTMLRARFVHVLFSVENGEIYTQTLNLGGFLKALAKFDDGSIGGREISQINFLEMEELECTLHVCPRTQNIDEVFGIDTFVNAGSPVKSNEV